jgi:hypothetical protein
MTPQEFKAWFEGYTEALDDIPTAKQWKRIRTRVAEIDGCIPTMRAVSWDRYWPYVPLSPNCMYSNQSNLGIGVNSVGIGVNAVGITPDVVETNISEAFSQLGSMDAAADIISN